MCLGSWRGVGIIRYGVCESYLGKCKSCQRTVRLSGNCENVHVV